MWYFDWCMIEKSPATRHGVNSIPELELMVNSKIDHLKKMESELRNFELELKVPTKN